MKPYARHRGWCTRALAVWGVLVIAFTMLAPSPAAGNPGLRVDGALVSVAVDPGVTYDHTMFVSSAPGDPKMEIDIRVRGFGRTLEGAYTPLSPEAVDARYSAYSFIDCTGGQSFLLEAGATQQVDLSIKVPVGVGAGGRYALIGVQARRVDEGGLGTVAMVQVPVLLTVSRTELVHTGDITSLVFDNLTAGQPATVSTILTNTGNHHYKAANRVIIRDPDGEVILRGSAPLTDTQIIPLSSNLFEVMIPAADIPDRLAAGTYQIESQVLSEDGGLLDSQTVTFLSPGAEVPHARVRMWLYLVCGLAALLLLVILGAAIRRWRRKRARAS